MKINRTERGFAIGEFDDRYNQKCSLQMSSLAEEPAIWFGVSNTGPHMGKDANKDVEHGRMHLTQEMVAKLIPHLQSFVETGELHPKDIENVKADQVVFTKAEATEIQQALQSQGIFDTPLNRLQLKDSWGEYHQDATERRSASLQILGSKLGERS